MNREQREEHENVLDLRDRDLRRRVKTRHKGKPQWISSVIVSVLFVSVFGLGLMVGQKASTAGDQVAATGVISQDKGKQEKVDFSPFWKVWNLLDNHYVDSSNLDNQDKVWGAIKGLAKSTGDPYTEFYTPEEAKEFNQMLSGKFQGVGMRVDEKDGQIIVIAPLKGMPAEKAGILAGDIILKIDDTEVEGLTIDEAIDLIRGEEGTIVKLTIFRPEALKKMEIPVERGVITVPSVETEKRDDGVFVINVYEFNNDVALQFDDALDEFFKSGDDKLLIDLRSNPGGYLEDAVKMTSRFLPGDKVIVRQVGRGGVEEDPLKSHKGFKTVPDDVKVVILVDHGSASASEIMAGALQEHGRATLVGAQTYGKGSVQEVMEVTPDTQIKITVAKWLTPNGVSISDNGLTPDVEVEYTLEDRKADRDPQLKKAIEILHSQQ